MTARVSSDIRGCSFDSLTRLALLNSSRSDEPLSPARQARTPTPTTQRHERMHSLLDDLARDFDRMRIVLIGHSATKWALDHLLKGQDLTAAVTTDFAWQPG